MKLVIGGYAQGKLEYVLHKYKLKKDVVWDGIIPDDESLYEGTIVINHFHQLVRQSMVSGGSPENEVQSFLNRCRNCIIISDEIGNGIVPVEAFERECRERTGRILVQLAQEAEEVERVICGIGQKIK